ncbi:MAG TPA: guanylate kinase, partial [Planctomycetota bacterium]|nr:guanylate kinase [Planctomycetota bacterium]
QGAYKIQQSKIFQAVYIFIAPPDWTTLEERLIKRNTDDSETIRKRLQRAREELEEQNFYHHIIINNKLEQAIQDVHNIIANEQGGKL